jgi:hypothetical protein
LGRGRPGFPRDCSCRVVLELWWLAARGTAYGTLTRSGAAFQPLRACPHAPGRSWQGPPHRLTTPRAQRLPAWHARGLGRSRFARHYSGTCFASSGYLDVSVPPVPSRPTAGSVRSPARGLPHSETMGSQPDCGSPILTLLVCVLRRLVVPRHPPPAHHVLPGHGSLGRRVVYTRRIKK